MLWKLSSGRNNKDTYNGLALGGVAMIGLVLANLARAVHHHHRGHLHPRPRVGILLQVNLARVVHLAGVVAVANLANQNQVRHMMSGTVVGDSLAGGGHPQVVKVENLAAIVDGAHHQVAVNGALQVNQERVALLPAVGAHLVNQERVVRLVVVVIGALLENLERAVHLVAAVGALLASQERDPSPRDRNQNLPRVVDIGLG